MSLTASVVSAAILEGRLIIGLSDGSVIDCGYVQGPPGLSGEPGPMGATGSSGRDGNTIITVAGTPRNDMGTDGDYAIDNINWRIYGPKAGGVWGKANDMLPSKDNLIANGRAPSASGGGGGGDSSTEGGAARVYNTGNLRLTGTGKEGVPFVDAPGGNIIPEGTSLKFQANANGWFVDSLQALDTALPIDKVVELPDAGKYQGDMVLYKDALWVYHGTEWIEVGGAVDVSGFIKEAPEDGKQYVRQDAAWEELEAASTLQNVLDNGNIADKDIVLTDGVDDLIDISPTEGRIVIASDADTKTPKITLAHFGDHDDGNRKAELELDENGTRFDFEMSGDVKDVHFRFGDDEKFIINHVGDAEFTGKVKVEPGESGQEAVTFQQLAEIEEKSDEGDNALQDEIDNLKQEIEHLAPSFERGEWDLTTEWPSPGKYGVYKSITYESAVQAISDEYIACLAACDSDPLCASDCNRKQAEALKAIEQYDPDKGGSGFIYEPETDWEQVNRVAFAEKDALGISHSFDDVVPGQFMDLYNKEDEGYFIAQVESVSRDPDDEDIIIVAVDAAQWSEIPPNGRALVKFFTIEDGIDVADFVKKSGDKMSGNLHILKGRGPANSALSTVPFAVCRNAEEGGSAFRVIFNYLKEDGSTEINDVFKINNVGETNVLGNKILNVGDPTGKTDGVNRGYVENNFISKAGEQKLTSDKWNLRAPKTSDANSHFNYINIRNDEMNLYHVAEAADDKHAANWGQIKNYAVNKSGDVIKGKIEFNAPRTEEATNSFVIRGALKQDGVIKEGQVIFKDYRDGTGSNYESSMMYFGRIDGPNHIINKEYLEQYVADNAGEKSDKVIIESGSSVPTLEQGRMYLNTTTKIIHVGT